MKTISTVKFYNTIYIKQLLKLHEQICVTITELHPLLSLQQLSLQQKRNPAQLSQAAFALLKARKNKAPMHTHCCPQVQQGVFMAIYNPVLWHTSLLRSCTKLKSQFIFCQQKTI